MSNDKFPTDQAEDLNPYAAPHFMSIAGEGIVTEFDETRRKYLSHEASIQSIGTLFGLGAVIGIPVALGMGSVMMAVPAPDRRGVIMALLLLLLAVVQIFVAYGLYKLRSWARLPAILMSCLGLLGFPLGTLISVYFLYLLLSPKGAMVLSAEYREIVRQTPHIRYRTSRMAWGCGMLLLAVIGMVLALVLVG